MHESVFSATIKSKRLNRSNHLSRTSEGDFSIQTMHMQINRHDLNHGMI